MKRAFLLCAVYAGATVGCRQNGDASHVANDSQSMEQNDGFYSKEAIVTAMLAGSQTDQSKFKTLSTNDSEARVPILSEGEPEDTSRLVPMSEMSTDNLVPLAYDLDETEGVFELTQGEQQGKDLRRWDTPVKDQGQEGLCTAFATTAAMENLAKQKGQELDLSERHLWTLYGIGNMFMSTKAAADNRIVSEQAWPYASKAPVTNARGALRISSLGPSATVQGIIAMVQNNKPVVWGGQNPNFDSRGVVTGYSLQYAHSMAIVGVEFDSKIKGGGYFIIKNSWGRNSGDKGYIYMPFHYCAVTKCYAVPVLDVEVSGT